MLGEDIFIENLLFHLNQESCVHVLSWMTYIKVNWGPGKQNNYSNETLTPRVEMIG